MVNVISEVHSTLILLPIHASDFDGCSSMVHKIGNIRVDHLKHVLALHGHIACKECIYLDVRQDGILVMVGAIEFYHPALQVFDLQNVHKVTISDDDLGVGDAIKRYSFVKHTIFENDEFVVLKGCQ
jgi:hypothetical protein